MDSCCQSTTTCAVPQKTTLTVALVGNPNCGKTTLFNALTGARQHVGNWPGVTVERKSGYFIKSGTTVEIVDLPGVYSLSLASEQSAIDERIANDFIVSGTADVIVNIVDASHLERHLYLTMQLIEMGIPIILVLNMMDVARAQQLQIDLKALSQRLGCPVLALEANKGQGLETLQRTLICYQTTKTHKTIVYPEVVEKALETLVSQLTTHAHPRWAAIRLLEDDQQLKKQVSAECVVINTTLQKDIQAQCGEDADIVLADARYHFIRELMQQCVTTKTASPKTTWTKRLDQIVLNRVLGIPIFLAIMYALFFFSINIGGAFQDFFDMSSQALLVDGVAHLLTQWGAPTWLIALLANGIGKGINTTITFIPVIGAMFLFLAFLEDSGYMARAAFLVDRFMRMLGLPGKAFVPMIVGFGCNVPSVMGARTLENKRDRILTIMMSPFMSCGARLAIFAIFTAAFFPQGGQNIVFALYMIGILMAILTGFILRKTVLRGDPAPLIMELPAYHVPNVRTLFIHAWQRLSGFVVRAGKLIVPICVLIGALNTLHVDGSLNGGDGDAQSMLSAIGQWTTPVFAPMGIQADNWPATVGLVTGVLAKEVVVGTLNTIYSQVGHLAEAGGAESFQLWAALSAAWQSIPENLAQLTSAFSNPVLAKAPIDPVNQGVYGLMYEKFDGQIGAFAYLLFVLLYFPCISTMAAMLRELHRGWSIFSALWMTGVAYGSAVFFYQAATFTRHPESSLVWLIAIASAFFGTIAMIRWYATRLEAARSTA